MVFPLYLTGSLDAGELGFSQAQKGTILGISSALLYLFPIFIWAIADRIGNRKLVLVSTILLSACYFIVGRFTSFPGILFITVMIALSSSITKPIVPSTIVRTSANDRSLGLGIFYVLLNLGFLAGTIFASIFRSHDYSYVFYFSAVIMLVSYIQSWFWFRDKEVRKPLEGMILNTLQGAFTDVRHMLWKREILLLILFTALFSAAYNQLFFSLPVFINQWTNTRIESLVIVSLNFFYIIIFQIPLSALFKKIDSYFSMILGYFLCSMGLALTFMTRNPVMPFFSMLIFSIGQMIAIPKLLEFIKRISPPGKDAMYMGGLFLLPLAAGGLLSWPLSGIIFQRLSDKVTMLRSYLLTKDITLPPITENFTKNDFFSQSSKLLHLTDSQVSDLLWNTFHPNQIWIIYTLVCLLAVIGLVAFQGYIFKKCLPGESYSIWRIVFGSRNAASGS